ncbi:putative Serine phosphatase RsbU, regulator of sigma subunit [Candidatus Terasakiella magnetica]|nr:putative Serine phosphatase RsbU, regulator of sigma subunit [Candidatus Terasakiella magnetica]
MGHPDHGHIATSSPVGVLVVGPAPAETVVRAWAARGIRILHDQPAASPCLVCGPATPAFLTTGLNAPFAGFIERDDESEAQGLSEDALAAIRCGGRVLSITAAAAYGADVARIMSESIAAWLVPPQDVMERVEIALSEAVSNAVLHGNLGLDSDLRQSLAGLEQFQILLAERMADPALSRRRLYLTAGDHDGMIQISVTDQGGGFDFARAISAPVIPGKASGRGLQLILRLCDNVVGHNGGRGLTMYWRQDGNR